MQKNFCSFLLSMNTSVSNEGKWVFACLKGGDDAIFPVFQNLVKASQTWKSSGILARRKGKNSVKGCPELFPSNLGVASSVLDSFFFRAMLLPREGKEKL